MKFVALRLFRKLCRNRFISWKKYEIVGELRSVGKRWRLYILLHSPLGTGKAIYSLSLY